MKQTEPLFADPGDASPDTARPNVGASTEVVTEGRAFASMEAEWEELRAASPSATPFQSWAWLYSWWEHYGHDRLGLRLLTHRDEDGTLLGILPLALKRGTVPVPGRLLFVGSGITDHLDIIARRGHEVAAGEAFATALGSLGGWAVADLQQVGPSAAAWALLRAWGGPKAHAWQDGCPLIDLDSGGWEDRLELLSQKHRGNVRRTLRRAEYDGAGWEVAPPERAAEAARRLLGLHREAWEGRPIGPEHLTERFGGHLEAAAARMSRAGLGAVSELVAAEGVVVASHLLAVGPDVVEGYIGGANAEALRRYSIDSLYLYDLWHTAAERSISVASFGRGEEAYKMRWRPRVEHNRRLLLGRRGWAPLFAPYAAWRLGYARARRWANSEAAPAWVARAAARYRAARARVARHYLSKKSAGR